MKNTLTLLLLSVLVFSSCKKEKDSEELTTERKLIGKWYLKSFTYLNQTNQYTDGEYLIFESGGKLTANTDNIITYSTWDLLDEGKTLFIVDNGTLDVPNNGFKIKSITKTTMVLYGLEAGDPPSSAVTINLEK